MTVSDAEAREYVEALLRHFPSRLSEWEDTFCRDIRLRLTDGGRLTDKQRAVLDRLMELCAQQHGGHQEDEP